MGNDDPKMIFLRAAQEAARKLRANIEERKNLIAQIGLLDAEHNDLMAIVQYGSPSLADAITKEIEGVEVQAIPVAPRTRRNGLGQQLIDAIHDFAKTRDAAFSKQVLRGHLNAKFGHEIADSTLYNAIAESIKADKLMRIGTDYVYPNGRLGGAGRT